MTRLPVIHKPQPPRKPMGRQVNAAMAQWPKLITVTTDPDLVAVVAFCVIGLLIVLNVILRFPDFGAVIEQYNQF